MNAGGPKESLGVTSIEEARAKRLTKSFPMEPVGPVFPSTEAHTPVELSRGEIAVEWARLWAVPRADEPPEVKAYRRGAMRALRWVLFPEYRKPLSEHVHMTMSMSFGEEDPSCWGGGI
jgi:hypothetical protein